jgi:hypothetical protein
LRFTKRVLIFHTDTPFQCLRVDSPQLAANSSYRRKPVSGQAPNWMPDQVRYDKRQPISRCLRRVVYYNPDSSSNSSEYYGPCFAAITGPAFFLPCWTLFDSLH